MRSKAKVVLVIGLLCLGLAGAGCNAQGDADSEDLVDAQVEADALVVPGLGEDCATGCAGSAMCANESDSCATGYCLFDSRDDDNWHSYCTIDCSSDPCPEAYSCVDIDFSLDKACVADPALCGDGVVQMGEQCDDGNTDSDDGCRGDCRAFDTPAAEQSRLVLTATISGMYVPPGLELAEPFSIELDVEAQADYSGNGCGDPTVSFASGNSTAGPYVLVRSESCGDGGWSRLGFTVPAQQGSSSAPSVCADFRLPHPSGSPAQPGGEPLGAQVRYCRSPQSAGEMIVSSVGQDTVDAALRVRGSFDVPGALIVNEAIGGCDGFYAPSNCPIIVGDISMVASFELRNAPSP